MKRGKSLPGEENADVDNVECGRSGTELERLEEEAAHEWDDEEVVFDDHYELSVVVTEISHSGDAKEKVKPRCNTCIQRK